MAWEYPLREIAADTDRILRQGNVPWTWLVGQIIAHAVVQGPFTAAGQACAPPNYRMVQNDFAPPHHDRATVNSVAETWTLSGTRRNNWLQPCTKQG